MPPVEFVSVGNLSHDIISISNREYESLGGSSAYFSLISSKMGFKTGIVSKVGEDFREDYLSILKMSNVDLSGLRISKGKTTSFKNTYSNWKRKQILLSTSKKIKLRDFPEEYFDAKLIHFGPIYREISLELVDEASRKGAQIVLDVQGFCRKKLRGGLVVGSRWIKARDFLRNVNIVKATLKEAALITGERDIGRICQRLNELGPEIVLVTLGEEGAVIFKEDSAFKISPLKVDVVDPTGAGDAFTCGFVTKYFLSEDLIESASYAVSTASFIVEGIGLGNLPTKEMVEDRLREMPPSIAQL